MNLFSKYDWTTMLNKWPEQNYNIEEYHKILSPEYPSFLDKYIKLPMLQRLKGVGLLCGTDWTKLYKNRIYYSRLDHSIGVALIIWHFTHNKAQTIAGLLHDVSTPVFSHVSDFRKGDALTQTATEAPNESIIKKSAELNNLLREDNITIDQIDDYHKYPIADNEIPQLSADRLEYMFPSGMALDGSWTMEEIKKCHNDVTILKNEQGQNELGFKTKEIAELYCLKFCMIGHILQLNENKLTLHLLGQIMNQSEKAGLLSETDFMTLSEKEVIEKLNTQLLQNKNLPDNLIKLSRLYNTFKNMTKIEHTSQPLPENEYFSVSLKVKLRYINPLVLINNQNNKNSSIRLNKVSEKSDKLINDFLTYEDSPYGCVKII